MHCYIKQNDKILCVVVGIIISTQLSQTYDKGLVVFRHSNVEDVDFLCMYLQNTLFHRVSYHH